MKITVRMSTTVVSRAGRPESGAESARACEFTTVETVMECEVDAAPDTLVSREAAADVRRMALGQHDAALEAVRARP